MKEVLLIGLPTDYTYPDELIDLIKEFQPDVITSEYTSDFKEELANNPDKLFPHDFYGQLKEIARVELIGPTIKEYEDKGLAMNIANDDLTFMEYYEGRRITDLMRQHDKLAVILGGGHLPLNSAPVNTVLINELLKTDFEIHFKLINYISNLILRITMNHFNGEGDPVEFHYQMLNLRLRILQENQDHWC